MKHGERERITMLYELRSSRLWPGCESYFLVLALHSRVANFNSLNSGIAGTMMPSMVPRSEFCSVGSRVYPNRLHSSIFGAQVWLERPYRMESCCGRFAPKPMRCLPERILYASLLCQSPDFYSTEVRPHLSRLCPCHKPVESGEL